jgi:hypothetical protein
MSRGFNSMNFIVMTVQQSYGLITRMNGFGTVVFTELMALRLMTWMGNRSGILMGGD